MIWLQHHQCLKKKEGRKEDDESERWESRYNMKKRAKSEVYTDGLFLSLSLSFSAKVYCMYYGWITCALEEDDDERGRDDVASSSWKDEDEKYKFYRFSLLLIICSRFSCCSSASALHARESLQRSDLRSFERYELYWLNKEQYSPSSEAGDDAVAVSFPVFSLHFLCIMMMMMISWLSLSLSSSTEAGEGLSICEDIV